MSFKKKKKTFHSEPRTVQKLKIRDGTLTFHQVKWIVIEKILSVYEFCTSVMVFGSVPQTSLDVLMLRDEIIIYKLSFP